MLEHKHLKLREVQDGGLRLGIVRTQMLTVQTRGPRKGRVEHGRNFHKDTWDFPAAMRHTVAKESVKVTRKAVKKGKKTKHWYPGDRRRRKTERKRQ